MGRPPMKDEDKRKLISFRLSPHDLKQIEAYANAGGRSLAAEIERRLLATINLDEQGVQLVGEVNNQIAALEREEHGDRWHSTLTLWSAVKELLAHGPVEDHRPHKWTDDPEASEAYGVWSKLDEERKGVISALRAYGFPISENGPEVKRKLSIFGQTPNALLPMDGGRAMARIVAEQAPESEDRTEALRLLDRLAELDKDVEDARAAWVEHLEAFWKDEETGKQLTRRLLQREAQERQAQGKPYNVLHLYWEGVR